MSNKITRPIIAVTETGKQRWPLLRRIEAVP